MSIISEQVKRLRDYASGRKGEIADICNEAASTIEMLSKKARCSEIPNKSEKATSWISVEDRLPELGKPVFVMAYGRVCYAFMFSENGNCGYPVFRLHDIDKTSSDSRFINETVVHSEFTTNRISAWMPIDVPEPFKAD